MTGGLFIPYLLIQRGHPMNPHWAWPLLGRLDVGDVDRASEVIFKAVSIIERLGREVASREAPNIEEQLSRWVQYPGLRCRSSVRGASASAPPRTARAARRHL